MAMIKQLNNKIKKLFRSKQVDNNNEHNYDFSILVEFLNKLPKDILIEILVRVPADVIVQCPMWRNLMATPFLVDLHLKRADSINVVQSLYVDHDGRYEQKTRLSIVDCTRKKQCMDLVYDRVTDEVERTLWGSSGGLLAFWNRFERGCCISIVNPITGENRDISTPTSYGHLCGFFFDRFQGRHKLLYLDKGKKANDDVYHTFDLSENVWRKLDMMKYGLDISPRIGYIPVIVGDALHWIADIPYTNYCSKTVMVFKIETQELYSLSHPNVNNGGNSISATTRCDFGTYGGLINLIAKDGQLCCCHTIVEERVVELWLLEDYENWGSWVKKFKVNLVSIHKEFRSRGFPYLLGSLRIGSPQNGSNEILVTWKFRSWKGLYGYHLETHRSRQLETPGPKTGMFDYVVLPYTKTMLSPMF